MSTATRPPCSGRSPPTWSRTVTICGRRRRVPRAARANRNPANPLNPSVAWLGRLGDWAFDMATVAEAANQRLEPMTDLAKIFKAYDIRGIVPDELGEDVAEATGAA